MSTIDQARLIELFNLMADAIEREKDHLCELDGVIGDADHGVTMSIGFSAVRKALSEIDAAHPTDVFNMAAKAFLNAVGASAGPLYATAFMRAGAKVKGQTVLDRTAVAAMVAAMADGIRSRGKANLGDKTMLDAWDPAAKAALQAHEAERSAAEILSQAADAAEKGATTTIDMMAKKGRSARLGPRSVGHVDPGAASTAILLRAMADGLPAK